MTGNIPLDRLAREISNAESVDTRLLDPCRIFAAGLADELRFKGHSDLAERLVELVRRSRAASKAAGDARQRDASA